MNEDLTDAYIALNKKYNDLLEEFNTLKKQSDLTNTFLVMHAMRNNGLFQITSSHEENEKLYNEGRGFIAKVTHDALTDTLCLTIKIDEERK